MEKYLLVGYMSPFKNVLISVLFLLFAKLALGSGGNPLAFRLGTEFLFLEGDNVGLSLKKLYSGFEKENGYPSESPTIFDESVLNQLFDVNLKRSVFIRKGYTLGVALSLVAASADCKIKFDENEGLKVVPVSRIPEGEVLGFFFAKAKFMKLIKETSPEVRKRCDDRINLQGEKEVGPFVYCNPELFLALVHLCDCWEMGWLGAEPDLVNDFLPGERTLYPRIFDVERTSKPVSSELAILPESAWEILAAVIVKKIDQDDLRIGFVLDECNRFLDGKLTVEADERLKKKRINLRVENISVYTLLLIIEENVGEYQLHVDGEGVNFRERKGRRGQ